MQTDKPYVFRLQVSMSEASRMHMGQSTGQLRDDFEYFEFSELVLLLDKDFIEVGSSQEFHKNPTCSVRTFFRDHKPVLWSKLTSALWNLTMLGCSRFE